MVRGSPCNLKLNGVIKRDNWTIQQCMDAWHWVWWSLVNWLQDCNVVIQNAAALYYLQYSLFSYVWKITTCWSSFHLDPNLLHSLATTAQLYYVVHYKGIVDSASLMRRWMLCHYRQTMTNSEDNASSVADNVWKMVVTKHYRMQQMMQWMRRLEWW